MTDNKYTYRSQTTDESDYDDFDISSVEIAPDTPEDIREEGIKRIIELNRKIRPFELEKRKVMSILSDPVKREKVTDLAINAGQNIMLNNTLTHSEDEVLFKDFTVGDKELLKAERSSKINKIFEIVSSDDVVNQGISEIKDMVKYDTRKIRQDKRVGKVLDSLYLHKRQKDMAEQLKEHAESIAYLKLAQKETDNKLEQIGDVMLQFEDRFKALATLGIDEKKVELYKLSQEYPKLTQEELGVLVGKSVRTVRNWLSEVDLLTAKADEHITNLG